MLIRHFVTNNLVFIVCQEKTIRTSCKICDGVDKGTFISRKAFVMFLSSKQRQFPFCAIFSKASYCSGPAYLGFV